MTAMPGARLLKWDAYGTAAFVITAVGGALRDGWLRGLAVVIALLLFTVGCAAFMWALWLAVQRSRRDALGMGGLFFLAAPAAPGTVRRPFNLLLILQVTVGIATSILTFNIKPFTPLAFGVLAPVYGLGLAGWWGARYGQFSPRGHEGTRAPTPDTTE